MFLGTVLSGQPDVVVVSLMLLWSAYTVLIIRLFGVWYYPTSQRDFLPAFCVQEVKMTPS